MLIENIDKEYFSTTFVNRAEKIPVESIGLPKRAVNIVKAQNAKNSYEAISIIFKNFPTMEGIGEKTIVDLLKYFKSTKRITMASFDELAKVVGPSKAKKIITHFQEVQ